MLKKLLAGLTALALALGMLAVTAGPAGASPASPKPPVDPTPYVLVAWVMPSWANSTTPTWPQTYFTKMDLATKDLGALDGQLAACGVDYQVDLYNDSATTTALIQGGVLNGPNNPAEDFPSPKGWDKTYKLINNPDCEVTPAPVTFTAAQCVAGSPGPASYTIPSTPGVKYLVQLNGAGGFSEQGAGTHNVPVGTTVEVRAEALDGHPLTGTTEWSTTFAPPDCRVTPATPTFTPAVCSSTEPGEYGKASYTIPVTEGVQYQVRVNDGGWKDKAAGTYEVGAGAEVKVRAVAQHGYTLTGTLKWSVDFEAPDCLTDVIPTKPEKTEAVCTGDGVVGSASFTIPDITGITYQRLVGWAWVDIAPGPHSASDGELVVIRAVPLPGFELSDNGLVSGNKIYFLLFDNLVASKDCIVPDAPTFDPQQCVAPGDPSQASFTIPSDSGVTYEIWNGTFWEEITAGTYDVDTFPTQVKIRAVPDQDHHFVDDATTEWTFEFTSAGDCIVEVQVTPPTAFAQKCVVGEGGTGSLFSGYLVIPNSPNVEYFIDGSVTPATPGQIDLAPGSYTVTAQAASGYELVGYTGPWLLEIAAAKACGSLPDLPAVDPIVTFTQPTCSLAGSYSLSVEPAEESAGVIWTVSGGLPNTLGTHAVTTAGQVVITAVPAEGFGFPDDIDAFKEWSFDFAAQPTDCLPTLALTGGSIAAGGLGLGALLTVAGVLVFGARKREEYAQ